LLSIFRACVLGIIQGVTEFFPVSSSGHLTIVPEIFGWKEFTTANCGLGFSAVLHLGTLCAVAVFFREEWERIIKGFFSSLKARPADWNDNQRLAWFLVLATIPAALFGFLFDDYVEERLGGLLSVGILLACGAFLMIFAEVVLSRAGTRRTLEEFSVKDALAMGVFQVFSLAPGLSRSGATISGGIFSGLSRESAAAFSFLMLAPISLGAGLYEIIKMTSEGVGEIGTAALICGFFASAVSGFLAIRFLLRFLRGGSLVPFISYSFAVACATIALAAIRH